MSDERTPLTAEERGRVFPSLLQDCDRLAEEADGLLRRMVWRDYAAALRHALARLEALERRAPHYTHLEREITRAEQLTRPAGGSDT